MRCCHVADDYEDVKEMSVAWSGETLHDKYNIFSGVAGTYQIIRISFTCDTLNFSMFDFFDVL